MKLLALILALVALPAFGQVLPTCGQASTVVPQPWDEARVSWTRPATWSDGTALPATTALIYTVYRRVGATGTFAALCTTTAVATALSGQPVGQVFYTATARVGTGTESTQPTAASKTIVSPSPSPPTGITVASTRMEPDSWTCRDEAGVIISRHERADKAQESCTNQALAALLASSAQVSPSFEMRSSGYRIVARR
jgi:hypothetical protein